MVLLTVRLIKKEMKKVRDDRIRRQVMRNSTLQHLQSMTPTQFEHYVADLCRLLGYSATVTPRTGDGGKDIILTKGRVMSLAECKLYSITKVGRRDVQIFHNAVIDAKAQNGFFFTTGEFTNTAREYVKDKPIKLINGDELSDLIDRVSNHEPSAERLVLDIQ